MALAAQLIQSAATLPDPTNVGNYPNDGPLRAGGQLSSDLPASDANLPSTVSDAVKKQQSGLAICRDLDAGPERIRFQGTKYLPQAPGEMGQDYSNRLNRSPFFNVFAHTKEGLVGQVFRKDPVIGDDVPQVIQDQMENIDLAGTHFDVFVKERLADAITAGHCAIHVEFPKTGGTQPRSTELGPKPVARPYWIPILKDNIVSWRTQIINGVVTLIQLVLKEITQVPDGTFGEKPQEQYRVLWRNDAGIVGFSVLQITKDKRVLLVDEGLYPTQIEIPVAEIPTSGRSALFESTPPLLDLGYLNIAHYQQYSDYTTSIHKTCVPILTLLGFDPPDEGKTAVVVGPNTVLIARDPNAKAEYVSHTGAALNECKVSLDDLKSDMGTLGLAMLSPQKRTAETAAAKRLDKATEDSALATTARGLQDGIERALDFHARYLGLDDGGSVQVNKQFDTQQMQADMLTAWTGAVANAGIPARLMLADMQQGEIIDPDEDTDAIADEMAANQAAIDAQKQIEAQAAADAMAAKGTQPPPTVG